SILSPSCVCGSPSPDRFAVDLSPTGRGVARCFVRLSPLGRGRIASSDAIRVRGLSTHSHIHAFYPRFGQATPQPPSCVRALPLLLRSQPLPNGERCSSPAAAI